MAKAANAQNSHDVRQQLKQDILDKKRRPLPWRIASFVAKAANVQTCSDEPFENM